MILLTGAAGKTGRVVLSHLAAKGQRVRALARTERQAAALKNLGARESLAGDLREQATLAGATKGVQAIYHICPNMHPDETLIGERLIAAAQMAGVERFVFHSVLHPQVEAMAHHWQKMRVEEKLFESGLPYTILQPAAYMQNVLSHWNRIIEKGEYAVPYGLETRLSMVDLTDIGAVAAIVLDNEEHAGATYELCGRETLSQLDVAMRLSEVLEREVKGVVVPLDEWEQQARAAGLGGYAVETLRSMFRYYDAYGFRGNGKVLEMLLGRPAASFRQFLLRHVDG